MTTTTGATVADNISRRAGTLGLYGQQIADAAGITMMELGQSLNGHRSFLATELREIATLLGCQASDLRVDVGEEREQVLPEASPPDPPPCPFWCKVGAGHAYRLMSEVEPNRYWYRIHEGLSDDAVVALSQAEDRYQDGTVSWSSVEVVVTADPELATAAEVRRFADSTTRDLALAASVLDEIEARS